MDRIEELKRDILAFNDIKMEKVIVPEWGDMELHVMQMQSGERDAYELDAFLNAKNPRDIRAKMLVRTVCDENGILIFNESDIEALSQKSGAATNRLYEVALKLNSITDEDVEELKKK